MGALKIELNPDMDAVRRRAAKSNTDWLVWRNRDGVTCAARRSVPAIKQAMLDCGTGRKFTMYCSRSVLSMVIDWRGALILRNNTRRGY
ncbi:MAG: hypothetical protein EOP83_32625 [Verrucomicrobiaceae bacterium]|nr:MAG: hypothetical protein EOP83_32625 [Verrucomicrobiaceae bacterium]